MLESSLSRSHVLSHSNIAGPYPQGKKNHLIFPKMSELQWLHVWLLDVLGPLEKDLEKDGLLAASIGHWVRFPQLI